MRLSGLLTPMVAALALAACDSEPPPEALRDEASPGEVDVIQSGFGQEGNYIVPVVQLQAVPQDAGKFATVTWNLLDDAGELLVSAQEVERVTGTGSQYIAGWAEVEGAEVASVETTVSLSDYDVQGRTSDLVVAAVKPDGQTTISNPTDSAVYNLRITIACFDSEGTIVGGGVNFPHQIGSGEDIVITPFIQVTGEPDRCDATVQGDAL